MEHISQSINQTNAFYLYNAAHQRNLELVKQFVMKYITENFKSITSRSEFEMMPFDILVLLLQSDDLGIDSEIDIFVAIVRWVDHNRKERIRLAPSLLKCVRYQLIQVNFVITHIESADWMFRPRECHDWLYDVLR
jgi:kelch-like protein 17 (actinfilin)